MTLEAGRRLGHYDVVARLGAGGMGEVWRARDTRLDRDVALKLLPAAFSSDPERLARFEREARLLAALNHPHVASIHGLEELAGQRVLVMELAEGEDLAQRLKRGAMPIDEAVAIARQVAEALEEAHEKGIIHRDVKPANVKVSAEGQVKVLDFGLAKAWTSDAGAAPSDLSHSPTLAPTGTAAGMILGTAAYMSPEQAKGRPVDRRADIWGFGALVFEMLSGRRLFEGETVSETLASVIKDEPPWDRLPPATPPRIRQLLERCLTRDPKARLRDIGDARLELEAVAAGDRGTGSGVSLVSGRPGLPLWTLAAAVLTTALVVLGLLRGLSAPAPERLVRRFDLAVADLRADTERHPQISRDGGRVAWVAGGSLFVRELDRLEPRLLVRDADPMYPFWSPDGSEIAYVAGSKLWRVRASGGEPEAIAEAAFRRGGSTPGGAWMEDGRIVFAPAARRSGLLVVNARGGDFTSFLEPAPEEGDFHSPSPLPGNRGLLVVVDRMEEGPDTIQAIVGDRRINLLQMPGERFDAPVYSETGHVLYQRETANAGIWALPFSLDRLRVTGEPFLVAAKAGWPSVSVDGTLVHTRGDPAVLLELAWLERDGRLRKSLGEHRGAVSFPQISPDARMIAVALRDDTGSRDLYVVDVASGHRTRLTFGERLNDLRWATAEELLFVRTAQGRSAPQQGTFLRDATLQEIALRRADGSGVARDLLDAGVDPSVSSDRGWLAFARLGEGETGLDVWIQKIDPTTLAPVPGEEARALVQRRWAERMPRIRPGGGYLAYESDETGRRELYVTTFPEGQGKWQVTSGGVDFAKWAPAGDRLYFIQGAEIVEVEVTTRPAFTSSAPRRVLDAAAARVMTSQGFDVAADGSLVVIRRPVSAGEAVGAVAVVQNWFAEFAGPR